MDRQLSSWYSERLQKEMPVAVYGHYGFALLLIPTASADYLEYERFQLIDALRPYIDEGKVKVFSINSINSESWIIIIWTRIINPYVTSSSMIMFLMRLFHSCEMRQAMRRELSRVVPHLARCIA